MFYSGCVPQPAWIILLVKNGLTDYVSDGAMVLIV